MAKMYVCHLQHDLASCVALFRVSPKPCARCSPPRTTRNRSKGLKSLPEKHSRNRKRLADEHTLQPSSANISRRTTSRTTRHPQHRDSEAGGIWPRPSRDQTTLRHGGVFLIDKKTLLRDHHPSIHRPPPRKSHATHEGASQSLLYRKIGLSRAFLAERAKNKRRKAFLQQKHRKQKRHCCDTLLGGPTILPTRSLISKTEHVKQDYPQERRTHELSTKNPRTTTTKK